MSVRIRVCTYVKINMPYYPFGGCQRTEWRPTMAVQIKDTDDETWIDVCQLANGIGQLREF